MIMMRLRGHTPTRSSELLRYVTANARCARSGIDPELWFPISTNINEARCEAAPAIAICTGCPVKAPCLEVSLRYWSIGQHGVWGGTLPDERRQLRSGLDLHSV
jgi:WhiB family redox-sensing transcriptional regulator